MGKKICVKGMIKEYKGKPEVIVNDPAQIKIVPSQYREEEIGNGPSSKIFRSSRAIRFLGSTTYRRRGQEWGVYRTPPIANLVALQLIE